MSYSGTETIIKEFSSAVEELAFGEIYKRCRHAGFACAMFRLPNSDTRHLVIDVSGDKELTKVQLDEVGSGFVFHPFSTAEHKIRFIRRDIHITEHIPSKKRQVELEHPDVEKFRQVVESKFNQDTSRGLDASKQKAEQLTYDAGRDRFINLVSDAIEQIRNGEFQKVVLARNQNVKLPSDFSPEMFFEALLERYSNAFIYSAYFPGVGQWIGATPEKLISVDKERRFKTVALAATQACREDVDIADTTWSQKDIEEQAMVCRYIINCFKKIRLREFDEIGPRTYLSGNLVHLKTEYNVDMEQVAFPQLGTVMLDLLHPTSAVCGMPKEAAMQHILRSEGFDRQYFSGYLGPVNMLDETNIFVNLRCMKVMNGSAELFAGAGIIENSTPEKEWKETQIKMDTLLNVLKSTF